MKSQWTAADMPRLDGKLALVTGANRGLGFEIARGLCAAGGRVIIACRDPAKAESARHRLQQAQPSAQVESLQLDLADLASVRQCATEFGRRHDALDILCNNASAIMLPRGKTADGFETHLGTNHLGHFALTGLLLPALLTSSSARIVNTASIAHRLTKGLDLDDPYFEHRPYKEMDAYGQSKLAALLYTAELDRRLHQTGSSIVVTAAHPGYAATNTDIGGFFLRLSTHLFAQPANRGALPALYAATASDVSGGEYFGPSGFKELRGHPTRVGRRDEARDPLLSQRLWDWSQQQTGVHYLDQ